MIERSEQLPDLFQYVPADAQQVVVNRPARNIWNTQDISLTQIPAGVKAQFQQISLMLMVQVGQGTGDQMMLLDTNSDFSPQDFLSTLNSETEITYIYKRLDDGRYVFGPKELVSVYLKPTEHTSFFANKKLAQYTKIYKNYGMTIISHNQNSLNLPSQFAQVFTNVEYMVMGVNSEKSDISFVSRIVFKKENAFTWIDFSPEFTDYLKASTIGYFEVWPIASFIPAPQINTSLTGTDLVQQAVLVELAQQILQKNTAIILSKWSNPTNLWITIASENPQLFTKLKPWMPSIGQWLKSQAWLSGAVFSPVETATKIWYMITVGGQEIWLLLGQDSDKTTLSIGNPLLEWSSSQHLLYNEHSLATLDLDADQAMWIYKQLVNFWLQTDLSSTETLNDQLKWKLVRATIFTDSNGLWLEWEIK